MKDIAALQKLDIVETKRIEHEKRLEELKKLAAIERWRARKIILVGIAMLAGACVAPNMGKAFYYFMKDNNDRRERYRTKKAFKGLEREGLVRSIHNKKGWAMTLTKKGEEEVCCLKSPYLKLPQVKKWDGVWRLIISDIPEKYKVARDSLNRWLVRAGCARLQKSTWVYPYDCWDEVRAIVSIHNVSGCVRFAIVEKFNKETENELKKIFNLS